jgi:hypothetical protein
MSGQIILQKTLVVSLVLSLSGLALALEGFYFADGSGLLFGDYVCFAGFLCQSEYEFVRSMFWFGAYLLLPGLALMIVGGLLLRRVYKRRREGKARIFQNRVQRRLILASALCALTLIVFFLGPIVPFNTTFRDPSTVPAFPRVDVCYQNTPAVYNVVQVYSGLETPIHAIFGVGNFVYVQCTVVSGPRILKAENAL